MRVPLTRGLALSALRSRARLSARGAPTAAPSAPPVRQLVRSGDMIPHQAPHGRDPSPRRGETRLTLQAYSRPAPKGSAPSRQPGGCGATASLVLARRLQGGLQLVALGGLSCAPGAVAASSHPALGAAEGPLLSLAAGGMSDHALALALPVAVAALVWVEVGRRRAVAEVESLKARAERDEEGRLGERKGRIKAERQLRELLLEGAAVRGGGEAAAEAESWGAFPFTPIGRLRSCFTMKNGTPRQPLLIPAARSELQLRPGLPLDLMEGLGQYSHVWLLYVFDKNDDIPRLWEPQGGTVKGKVSVPRLNGGRMGALATRTPHRPSPIGLSVARVVRVDRGRIVLAGADVVDGSPILDIKPYVPFCDAVAGGVAPSWVAAEAEGEVLKVEDVTVPPEAAEQLRRCWEARAAAPGGSLYSSPEEFTALVKEVLSLDFRAVHHRLTNGRRGGGRAGGTFHVALDGAYIDYTISEEGGVRVVGAKVDQGPPGNR